MKYRVSLEDAKEIARCIVECGLSPEQAEEYIEETLDEINELYI